MEKTILEGEAVQRALAQMTDSIYQQAEAAPWAVVGIRRGGDMLAERVAELLGQRLGKRPPVGVVDITLYRDDGFGPHQFPQVGVTQIPFDVTAHTVLLVDDVLYTGRTVRAALDVILDYGRPKAVRLAVLVDRGLHELPIRADVVGLSLQAQKHEHVDVQLREAGAPQDRVVISEGKGAPR